MVGCRLKKKNQVHHATGWTRLQQKRFMQEDLAWIYQPEAKGLFA